jgi:hypothetical protein
VCCRGFFLFRPALSAKGWVSALALALFWDGLGLQWLDGLRLSFVSKEEIGWVCVIKGIRGA